MRDNNFDFLRLVAALFVIWAHVPPLLGQPSLNADFGAAGVFIFFSISGYLVTKSWQRDPEPFRFLSRRALRIFPGLAAAIAFCAVVIGPWLTTLPLAAYFSDPLLLSYARNILLFPITFHLPGVFEQNSKQGIVNGSLWTLPIEALMYVALAVLGAARLLTATTISFLLGALMVLVICANDWSTMSLLTVNLTELIDCAFCFFAGAFIAHCGGRLPMVSWAWVPVVALCWMWHWTVPENFTIVFCVPYAAIAFALRPLRLVKYTGQFGDFSYGIYIYSFPVMQVLVAFFPQMSNIVFFLAAVVLSYCAGALSWHFVEAPALRFKSRITQGLTATPGHPREPAITMSGR